MNAPARFLVTLGRALASAHLYPGGHPARTNAVEEAFAALDALLDTDRRPTFTFIDDAVLYRGRDMDDLRHWPAADRLLLAGMQRIEIQWPVPRAEFNAFLESAEAAAGAWGAGAPGAGDAAGEVDGMAGRHPSIRFGTAALAVFAVPDAGAGEDGELLEQTLELELEAMRHVLAAVGEQRIARFEVEAIVGSLLLGLASTTAFMVPLVRLRDADEYTVAHSLNVATLTMALAHYAGYPREQVRAIGIAGVLHDIGKMKVPREILNKAGPLTPEERVIIERHPVDGARMILESGDAGLELAAIVAYEHHIRYDGAGYPRLPRPRPCHPASDLLHVCDVYDAMATHRPYRPARSDDIIFAMIREQAGTEFAPGAARLFLEMMQRARGRFRVVGQEVAAAAV